MYVLTILQPVTQVRRPTDDSSTGKHRIWAITFSLHEKNNLQFYTGVKERRVSYSSV